MLLVATQLWIGTALLAGRIAELGGVGLFISASWRRAKPITIGAGR